MSEEPAIDHTARGLASEAIQATRSLEALSRLQFNNMENNMNEIRKLIADTRTEMQVGFKTYDAKFWALAIIVIGGLFTGVVTLLVKAH